VRAIKKIITTEFNIEGNPLEDKFVALVLETLPTQVTLVPDAPGQLTSNHGWDTVKEREYLRDIINVFKTAGIRVSIFVDSLERIVAAAADTGTDRVELYTEDYAKNYRKDRNAAIADYIKAADVAAKAGLGLNAGHDLDLDNLMFFKESIPALLEVSIGHALIADALYYGLENVIQLYKRKLN
jgi:pyridoxine 5-phosphate synthase